jgi:hypothetical protein
MRRRYRRKKRKKEGALHPLFVLKKNKAQSYECGPATLHYVTHKFQVLAIGREKNVC